MDDVNQKLIEQLIRVVDKISATFADNQKNSEDFFLENQKHTELLLKESNAHYELLEKEGHTRYENIAREIQKQHEELSNEGRQRYEQLMLDTQKRTEAMSRDIQKREDEIREENKKAHNSETKRMRWDAFIIVFISTFSICLSILFTNFWDLQGKKIDLRRVELTQRYNQEKAIQDRVMYLQSEINNRFTLRNQLMEAMVNVRAARDIVQKQCKNSRYAGRDAIRYQQQLFSTTYALVGATYKTIGIFSNEIKNKILQFEALASVDHVTICAKNSATENQLRLLQSNIDDLILASNDRMIKEKSVMVQQFPANSI